MKRYFFDFLANGSRHEDDIGLEFRSLNEVRSEAMRGLPAIATEKLPTDGDQPTYTILVKNEDGDPAYTATLNFAGLWLAEISQRGDTARRRLPSRRQSGDTSRSSRTGAVTFWFFSREQQPRSLRLAAKRWASAV